MEIRTDISGTPPPLLQRHEPRVFFFEVVRRVAAESARFPCLLERDVFSVAQKDERAVFYCGGISPGNLKPIPIGARVRFPGAVAHFIIRDHSDQLVVFPVRIDEFRVGRHIRFDHGRRIPETAARRD